VELIHHDFIQLARELEFLVHQVPVVRDADAVRRHAIGAPALLDTGPRCSTTGGRSNRT
jgi:hypothetical protein